MWSSPVSNNTMVWAAMRAANMLLPGTPGAQKETLIFVPPSSRPSFSRRASSAISAVVNSNTANRRKLPSWPWANWREEHAKVADTLVPLRNAGSLNVLRSGGDQSWGEVSATLKLTGCVTKEWTVGQLNSNLNIHFYECAHRNEDFST